MDESVIAERLKQNLTKPPEPEEIPSNTPEGERGYVSDIGDAMEMYKMYDFFDVQTQYRNSESEQKIQTVYRWAASQLQTTDYLEVVRFILSKEQGMGGSTFGSRLDRMYKYVKLENQIDYLRQEQGIL